MADAQCPVNEAQALAHALSLAQVGGTTAVTPELLAQHCRVAVDQLPVSLRSRARLVERTSPRAARKFAEFIDERLADVTSPTERLRGLGMGYIEFAMQEPGWFDLAFFAPASLRNTDSEAARGLQGLTPYNYLTGVLNALVTDGHLAEESVPDALLTCWCGVHGFATLAVRGALRSAPDAARREMAGTVVDRLVRSTIER